MGTAYPPDAVVLLTSTKLLPDVIAFPFTRSRITLTSVIVPQGALQVGQISLLPEINVEGVDEQAPPES